MSVTHSVAELVEAVGASYRAIDIRTVAIREDDSWVCVLTVLRLTYEDVDSARERIANLARQHPAVQTKLVRIELTVRPFAEWTKLCSEMRDEGVLHLGDSELKLKQPLDLSELRSHLQWGNSEARSFDGREWPGLWISRHIGGTTRLIEERFSKEVNLVGYGDVFEAINSLCELNVSLSQNRGDEFLVYVPVFAALSEVVVNPKELRVDVHLVRHRKLRNVGAVAKLWNSPPSTGSPLRNRKSLDDFESETDDHLVEAHSSAHFEELSEDGWLQVQLAHPIVGTLQRIENYVRMFVPNAERNVLLEALRLFCNDDTLDSLVLRAYNVKAPKLNESAAFELHVAWILGLLGLSTIVLGDYEHIIAPNTKVRRATVDILAAHQRAKLLLMVACTLNPPKAEDFGNLRYAREILVREVFGGTAVRVVPMLFTSATGCLAYDGDESGFDCIPIVDADRMMKVIELVREGQESRVLGFLNNPSFSDALDS